MQHDEVMKEMTSERLALRPFRPDDRPLLAALLRDERVFFWRRQPVPDGNVDATMARSRRLAPLGMGWFATFRREDGRFLGDVVLQPTPLDDDEAIEIGWHFRPEHWGNGYATEAASLLLDHAFATLRLPRVVAFVLPSNEASLRVIRRLGLPYIGERQHAGLPHVLFALTNEQYMAARAAAPN